MAQGWKRLCTGISIFLAAAVIIFASIGYVRYQGLKKALLAEIAKEATGLIGQKVDIGDASIGLPGMVNVYDLAIRNPEGFKPGYLLRIRRISASMDLGELLKRRYHATGIVIDSPRLSLRENEQGVLNVSQKLRDILSRKGETDFRVDNLRVKTGSFDLNEDPRLTISDADVTIRNLSSRPASETTAEGSARYSDSDISVHGSFSLRDDPKRFSATLSSGSFVPSAFADELRRGGVDASLVTVAADISVQGDTERGFTIRSTARTKGRGFSFFRQENQDLRLDADIYFDLRNKAVSINALTLKSGGSTSALVKGTVRDVFVNPLCDVYVTAAGIDLSRLVFFRNAKLSGIVSSAGLQVRGSLRPLRPRLSGSIRVRDASVSSADLDIRRIDSRITFSPDKEVSVKADSRMRIVKAGGLTFSSAPDTKVLLRADGTIRKLDLGSSVTVSPFAVHMKDGKTVRTEGGGGSVTGRVRGRNASGKASIHLKGVRYADGTAFTLTAAFGFELDKHLIRMRDVRLSAGSLKAGAAEIQAGTTASGSKIGAEHIALSHGPVALKNGSASLNMRHAGKGYAGGFRISSGALRINGAAAGSLSGNGRFDENEFFAEVRGSSLLGGDVTLSLRGRTSGSVFPVAAEADAAHLDLALLSKAAGGFIEVPYDIAEGSSDISFRGVIQSENDYQGHGTVRASRVSVRRTKAEKEILKGLSGDMELNFKGRDLDYAGKIAIGKIHVGLNGTASEFGRDGRKVHARVSLPETRVTDMRESLWDVFPDRLLYVGLQGSLSSDLSVDYARDLLRLDGPLLLKDLSVTGEDGEYFVGPVNGTVPISYARGKRPRQDIALPAFEPSNIEALKEYFSHLTQPAGASRVTIGSVDYGFRILEDISVLMKQKEGVLDISRLSAKMFGGRLDGSAVVDLSEGINYRVGALLQDMSLRELCNRIEPIRGYMSGKVAGTLYVRSEGPGLRGLLGRADLRTYATSNEKTRISKEFLRKLAGPSMKKFVGDRSYDKGVLSAYLQNGFIIFRELEISNRNFFGMQDLSVKVAPFNNRISLDHLMWTITEAAHRAGNKQEGGE